MAKEIKQKRTENIDSLQLISLDSSWVQQFLKRQPHLQTVISYSIEASRVKEVTKEVVISFFNALEACMVEYQISWKNVYNMNETGIFYAIMTKCRLCCRYSTNYICCG